MLTGSIFGVYVAQNYKVGNYNMFLSLMLTSVHTQLPDLNALVGRASQLASSYEKNDDESVNQKNEPKTKDKAD